MNELQKRVFELLKIFIEICEKYDIEYYLVCGSALGTVKYNGFIPWDDDVDIGLLRHEYERFIKIAQKELPEGFFIQNYKTDPGFPHAYSKLRNSNTTFLEEPVVKLDINHGIYIDIFPIDGHPKKCFSKMIFHLKRKMYLWIQYSYLEDNSKIRIKIRNKIIRFFVDSKGIVKAQKRLDNLYSKYSTVESELWCNYSNRQGKLEYAPKSQYGNGVWMNFEGLQVRIPEKYDAYLTQKYGDWRSELPVEKQKSHHKCIICDTEHSYTYYCSDN